MIFFVEYSTISVKQEVEILNKILFYKVWIQNAAFI